MSSTISDVIKSGFLILLLVVPFMSFCGTAKHDCLITNVNIVDVVTGKPWIQCYCKRNPMPNKLLCIQHCVYLYEVLAGLR